MISPRYTYPIKGISYFLSNWSLIRKILCALFLTLVVVILVLGLTFSFLLRLQAHALIHAGVVAALAWTLSALICIVESALFTMIFYLIALPIWMDGIFDEVLRLRGLGLVLENPRHVSELTLCCRGVCSGLTLAFFQLYMLVLFEVLILILTTPLHIIPGIGTLLYCYLNGWLLTWGHQLHYHLEIKEWTLSESRHFAWRNRDDYTMFGMVAVALELIPVLNFLFMWTNVVGAALWTADVLIEEQNLLTSNSGRSIPDYNVL